MLNVNFFLILVYLMLIFKFSCVKVLMEMYVLNVLYGLYFIIDFFILYMLLLSFVVYSF